MDYKGNITDDSLKAVSFALMTNEPNDSVWVVNQYSLAGLLLTSGGYRDAKMEVPHGPFVYYTYVLPKVRVVYNFDKHKTDTLRNRAGSVPVLQGRFINGLKDGIWTQLDTISGRPMEESTYKADKLEGHYALYHFGKIFIEGMYIGGLKDGDWKQYSYEGELENAVIFNRGERVEIKHYNVPFTTAAGLTFAKFDYNLKQYLNKQLAGLHFDSKGKFRPEYNFTIGADGSISLPSIVLESTVEVDTAVVNALLSAPKPTPTKKDGAFISHRYAITINVSVDNKNVITVDPKQLRIVLKLYP